MGNNPSSQHTTNQHHPNQNNNQNQNQQQQQQPHQQQLQSRLTPSAPPTPTGTHHSSSTLTTQSIQPHSIPPPTTVFVDGGYLFPISNIYPSSPQDWLQPIVQNLILSRRLAPFYRGLEDWEPDWDRQTITHALQSITFSRINAIKQIQKIERHQAPDQSSQSKNHPSHSITKRFSTKLTNDHHSHSSSSNSPQSDTPRQLIFEAVLNSQIRPNELDRYLEQTVECPICFLYYPPNINLSRCCQQPICTECFTQIKRTDPTPQEIKSEPACCPYCVEAHFGVTYEPPPKDKRTDSQSAPGAISSTPVPLWASSSPSNQGTMNSQSAPTSNPFAANLANEPPEDSTTETPKMKRRQTTSHTSKQVVTTDSIQPDWQAKLEAVQAAVQRRANRRIIFRQEGDRLIPVGITSSRDPSGSAFLAAFEQEHSASSSLGRRGLSALMGGSGGGNSSSYPAGTTGSSTSRRHRTENSNYGVDLEELMIMEAMRLSLAEEEDRKRKAAEEEEKITKIARATTDHPPSTGATTDQSEEQALPNSRLGIVHGSDEREAQGSSRQRDDQQDPQLHPNPNLDLNSRHSIGFTPSTSTPTPTGRLNQLLSDINPSEPTVSTNPFRRPPHPIIHDLITFQGDDDPLISQSPVSMIQQNSSPAQIASQADECQDLLGSFASADPTPVPNQPTRRSPSSSSSLPPSSPLKLDSNAQNDDPVQQPTGSTSQPVLSPPRGPEERQTLEADHTIDDDDPMARSNDDRPSHQNTLPHSPPSSTLPYSS